MLLLLLLLAASKRGKRELFGAWTAVTFLLELPASLAAAA